MTNCKILIADDEVDLLEMYRDYFESEGIEVLTAPNGDVAFNIFNEANSIELIISDSNMGKVGGLDLLNLVKNSGKKKPLFYLATGDLNKEEKELYEMGVNRIIYKPFDLDEVILLVKKDLNL